MANYSAFIGAFYFHVQVIKWAATTNFVLSRLREESASQPGACMLSIDKGRNVFAYVVLAVVSCILWITSK